MKTWQKTLILIALSLILLIAVLYVTSQTILGESFRILEEEDTRKDVQRALGYLSNELATLDSKTGDWANWDDAYQFVQNGNPQFIEINPTDTSFQQLEINLLVFLQPSGKIVYAKAFDLENLAPVPLPSVLQDYVRDPQASQVLLQNTDSTKRLTGILPLPDGPMLIAARPILSSAGEGPIHGTLIFGRYLDAAHINKLSETIQLSLVIHPVDDLQMPDDFQSAQAILNAGTAIHVQPLNRTKVAGYALLQDIFGQPAILLRVDEARDIYAQGREAMRYFMMWVVGIALVFGLTTQITVNRLAASRLGQQESEQKFRYLAQQSIDGIVIADRQGKVVEWNRTQEEITGILREEIVGLPIWEAHARLALSKRTKSKRSAQIRGMIMQALATEQAPWLGQVLTQQIRRPDGTERTIEVVIFPIKTETGFMLGGSVRDVTERKRAQAALQESEERYRAVIEQAAEGILLLDPDTYQVIEANSAFREMLGYTVEDTAGLRLFDLVNDDPEMLIQEICQVRQVKSYRMGERSYRRKDGALIITSTSASLVTFGGRAVISMVVRDITALKQAEAEQARLFQQEQMRRAELATLYGLSRQLADSVDAETILGEIVHSAIQTVHTTFARILLLEGADLVLRASYPVRPLGQTLEIGYREPLAFHPYCQAILEHDTPVLVHREKLEVEESRKALLGFDLAQSLCLVPLRGAEGVLGLLVLGEARRADRERFTAEKIHLAQSIGDQAASALQRAQLFADLEKSYLETVLTLARAVDAKDTYTADHAERLAEMALEIGERLGMSRREIQDLRYGAILHDVGKIGVPDAVLKKPGKLDAEEWKLMRAHPLIGARILAPVPRLAGAAQIVRHHHERYDGKGYPDGLKGEAIPLGARILTAVDSYSAIVDERVYKPGRSTAEAIAELKKHAGTQFDPGVVEIFLEMLDRESAWVNREHMAIRA